MLPTLFYTTVIFWLVSVLQAALIPFWLGDFVFLAIFIWTLYFARFRERMRLPIWNFWVPLIIGLGLTGFLFYSYWVLAPYLLSIILFSAILTQRSKWVFRWKEGSAALTLVFVIFVLTVLFIRREVMQYALTSDFGARFLITFILGTGVWVYFVSAAKRGKIR